MSYRNNYSLNSFNKNSFIFQTEDGDRFITGYNLFGNDNGNHQNLISYRNPTLLLNNNVKDIKIIADKEFLFLTNNNIYVKGENYLYFGLDQYKFNQINDNSFENTNYYYLGNNTNLKIKKIVGNETNIYFLTEDGLVYSCGNNQYGQLGLEHNIDINYRTKINIDNIKDIFFDEKYPSLFLLTNDGLVYACGMNDKGQLGINDNINKNIPTLIPSLAEITKIFANNKATFMIDINNDLHGFGDNAYNQLGGLGIYLFNFNLNKIITSNSSLFLINSKNNVYSCGANDYGQLGLGDSTNNHYTPILIPNLTNIKDIIYNSYSIYFLTNDNTVYSCGYNGDGELGLGNTVNRNTPTLIPNLTNIKEVISNSYSTYFLTNDNTVYSCGLNNFGQLGLGNTVNRNTPTLIPNLNNVKEVISNNRSSYFLTNDNKVYSCGYNGHGQLGLGDSTNNHYTPTLIPNLTNIKKVICSANSTYFFTNDGLVYSCGYNGYGQLGLGDTTNRTTPILIPNLTNVKEIICNSNYSTYLLTNDGLVYSCGYNIYGQLGLGDTTNRTTPILIPNLTNVKEIINSNYSTYLLTNDELVYSCGYNVDGELGLGDTTNRYTPTLIPNLTNVKEIISNNSSTYLLTNDGLVYSCGWNQYGQLGLGNTVNRNTPTLIPNLNNVKEVISNNRSSYFLTNDGLIYSCGYNGDGELGLGDTNSRNTPLSFITSDYVTDIYYNRYNSSYISYINFFLTNTHRLYKFGFVNKYYNYGQLLENNNSYDINIPQPILENSIDDIKKIYCKETSIFILKNNNELYSCGYNAGGQLGVGDTINRYTPTIVNNINEEVINIIQDDSYSFITYFLTSSNNIFISGKNTYGQFGNGLLDNTIYSSPILIDNLKNITKIVFNHIKGEMLLLNINNNISKIYLTNKNYNIINGNYKATILNIENLLKSPIKQIEMVNYNTNNTNILVFFVTEEGKLYYQGNLSDRSDNLSSIKLLGQGTNNNGNNNFTEVANLENVKKISVSNNHSLVLTNDGYVYSSGINDFGQLGLGRKFINKEINDVSDRSIFEKVDSLSNIIDIKAVNNNSFFLDDKGFVYHAGKKLFDNENDINSIPIKIDGIINAKKIETKNLYLGNSFFAFEFYIILEDNTLLYYLSYDTMNINKLVYPKNNNFFYIKKNNIKHIYFTDLEVIFRTINDEFFIYANNNINNNNTFFVKNGLNYYNKIEKIDNIKDIQFLNESCMILLNDGSLLLWGINNYYQLIENNNNDPFNHYYFNRKIDKFLFKDDDIPDTNRFLLYNDNGILNINTLNISINKTLENLLENDFNLYGFDDINELMNLTININNELNKITNNIFITKNILFNNKDILNNIILLDGS